MDHKCQHLLSSEAKCDKTGLSPICGEEKDDKGVRHEEEADGEGEEGGVDSNMEFGYA
jgi:hypothetical protein